MEEHASGCAQAQVLLPLEDELCRTIGGSEKWFRVV
jgi:hypothetical protein